jgi:acid phosphatase family membrane protein YuiD
VALLLSSTAQSIRKVIERLNLERIEVQLVIKTNGMFDLHRIVIGI